MNKVDSIIEEIESLQKQGKSHNFIPNFKYFQAMCYLVGKERARQDEKFPGCDGSNIDEGERLSILMEEVGEIANAMLEKDYDNIDTEIVQVAAVCFKWWQMRRQREELIPIRLTPIQKLVTILIDWAKETFNV